MVDAATDNRNRTAGELRFLFSRHEGTLGESGSVGWMFDAVGFIEADPAGQTEERFIEQALIDGVEDVEYDEDVVVVYTQPAKLAEVRDALRERRAEDLAMRISACERRRKSSCTAASSKQRWHSSMPSRNTKTSSACSATSTSATVPAEALA